MTIPEAPAPPKSPVTDAMVSKALIAYESLPWGSGLEARMRAALETLRKPRRVKDGGQ